MPPRRKRPVSSSLSSSSSSHTNNQNNAVKRGKKQTKIPPASGATDVDVDVEMETKPPEVTGTGIGNAASAASAAEGGMASDHIRRLLETLSKTSSVLMQLELGHEIADFVLRQTNRPNEDRRCVFRSVVDSICSGNWDQRRAAAALAAAVATKWRHKYKGNLETLLEKLHDDQQDTTLVRSWNTMQLDVLEATKIANNGQHLLAFDETRLAQEIDEMNIKRSKQFSHEQMSKIVQWKILETVGQSETNDKILHGIKYGEAHKVVQYDDTVESEEVRKSRQKRVSVSRTSAPKSKCQRKGSTVRNDIELPFVTSTISEMLDDSVRTDAGLVHAIILHASMGMFNHQWEYRHGSCMVLNESIQALVNTHSENIAHETSATTETKKTKSIKFFEDILMRAVSVLLLDKFGDYSSGKVVAPVRQSAARIMSSVCQEATKSMVEQMLNVLIQLFPRTDWHGRHGIVLALRELFKQNLLIKKVAFEDFDIRKLLIDIFDDPIDDVQYTGIEVFSILIGDSAFKVDVDLLAVFFHSAFRSCCGETTSSAAMESILPAFECLCERTLLWEKNQTDKSVKPSSFALLVLTVIRRFLNLSEGNSGDLLMASRCMKTIVRWLEMVDLSDSSRIEDSIMCELLVMTVDCMLTLLLVWPKDGATGGILSLVSRIREIVLTTAKGNIAEVLDFTSVFTLFKWQPLLNYQQGDLFYIGFMDYPDVKGIFESCWSSFRKQMQLEHRSLDTMRSMTLSDLAQKVSSKVKGFQTLLQAKPTEQEQGYMDDDLDLSDIDVEDELVGIEPLVQKSDKTFPPKFSSSESLRSVLNGNYQEGMHNVMKAFSSNCSSRPFFEATRKKQETLCFALVSLYRLETCGPSCFLILKIFEGLLDAKVTIRVNSLLLWIFAQCCMDSSLNYRIFEHDLDDCGLPHLLKDALQIKYPREISNTTCLKVLSHGKHIVKRILNEHFDSMLDWFSKEPENAFASKTSASLIETIPGECRGVFGNFLLCLDSFVQAAALKIPTMSQNRIATFPNWVTNLAFMNKNAVLSALSKVKSFRSMDFSSKAGSEKKLEEITMQQTRLCHSLDQTCNLIQSNLSDFMLFARSFLKDTNARSEHLEKAYETFSERGGDLLSRIYWNVFYSTLNGEKAADIELHHLLSGISRLWLSTADETMSNIERISGTTVQWDNPLVSQYFERLQNSHRLGVFEIINSHTLNRNRSDYMCNLIYGFAELDRKSSPASTNSSNEKAIVEMVSCSKFAKVYSKFLSATSSIAVLTECTIVQQEAFEKRLKQVLDILSLMITALNARPCSLETLTDTGSHENAIVASALYDVLLEVLVHVLVPQVCMHPDKFFGLLQDVLDANSHRCIAANSLCCQLMSSCSHEIRGPMATLLLRNALRSRSKLATLKEPLAIANRNIGTLFRYATEDCLSTTSPGWCSENMILHTLQKERQSLRSFSLLQSEGSLSKLTKEETQTLHGLLNNVTLRDYQTEGIGRLLFLLRWGLNGCLADDMGLGKTLQTLAAIAIAAKDTKENSKKKCLVVCPASIVHHWSFEAQTYFPSNCFNCVHYHGTKVQRQRSIEAFTNALHNGNVSMLICSFGLLAKDVEIIQQYQWDYCVLDEAHVISNPNTKIAHAIKSIAASYRVALTGTPIQNRLSDVWSIFDFLMPGYLGDKRNFRKIFERPVMDARSMVGDRAKLEEANNALKKLHFQLKGLILRRTKTEVLSELPDKVIQDVTVELSKKQKEIYRTFCGSDVIDSLRTAHANRKSTNRASDDGDVHLADMTTSSKLQALQDIIHNASLGYEPAIYQTQDGKSQAAGVPETAIGNSQRRSQKAVDWKTVDASLATDDLIHSHTAHENSQLSLVATSGKQEESENGENLTQKLLVFSRFPKMLKKVEEALLKPHFPSLKYSKIDGSTPTENRQSIAQEFNADPNIKVLLLSTGVGNLGLNLASANIVVFIDHSWNPFNDLQAMDRAHRLGQRQTVFVYRLISKGTIEEEIMNVQEFKKLISSSVIGSDEESPSTVSAEAIDAGSC